ncbi:MAG: pyruvate dehydrogenase complex E1 component subunit beta [Chloroflexi bacterium]|nr:pyruvate dehydrogenase complex E1 component subunit beta [Chloroflexota bacterium]
MRRAGSVATLTYREALTQALREELRRDPAVFLMGEEIGVFEGSYKVTAGLYQEFGPERVLDTPIAEEGFVGAAIGAAMVGMRPVVEIMTINFSLLALDQLVNNAAKMRYMFGGQVMVPLVIRTPAGAGQQLAAQHSQNLEIYYAHIPGLKVVAPGTPEDAKGMLKTAIRDNNPVLFIENIGLYNTRGEVPESDYTVPFGKAEVRRAGRDVTIVTYSRMLPLSLEAARRLEEEGIDCEVVDLRSLRPLDRETIAASVKHTNRAVVVEEGWPSFGISAEVTASIYELAFDYLDAPIKRVGSVEVPMPYSKPLENLVLPNVGTITQAVRAVMGKG